MGGFGGAHIPELILNDDHRAGIAYLGYKGHQFGYNSEWIRHALQNKLVHDWFLGAMGYLSNPVPILNIFFRGPSPHFLIRDDVPDRLYYNYSNFSPYTYY